jgi:drug/metabolite transporter (DMT)-like permease
MNVNEDVFNISATIFVVIITMFFILLLIKRILDYRIKNKIADRGIPESIASSILRSDVKENESLNIKWFFILAGIGSGLTIVNYTMPLGIHSLAIMSFSVAFSFLGYHIYIARTKKNSKGEK